MQRVEAEQLLKLALNDYSASFHEAVWLVRELIFNLMHKYCNRRSDFFNIPKWF